MKNNFKALVVREENGQVSHAIEKLLLKCFQKAMCS